MPRSGPKFTPEFRLLAACSWLAPSHLESYQTGQIQRCLDRPIDWQAFLELVARHRVAPLVAANLRRHLSDALLPPWFARLARQETLASEGALRLAGELVRLGRLLSANRIEVLPLKGALLSLQLFGRLGMRDARDIDVLISPTDVWRADQLLLAAGYSCILPDFELSEHLRPAALRVAHHFVYCHNTSHSLVELHWRLHHWQPALVTHLWERCGRREWMGVSWKDPAPDHLVVLLCGHGAAHKWSSLKWLGDVATLIATTPEALWDSVFSAAARFDLERPLAQAALLCSWIFSLPLPQPLLLFPECKPILDEMIEKVGFWIGNVLRSRFLIGVGGARPERSLFWAIRTEEFQK